MLERRSVLAGVLAERNSDSEPRHAAAGAALVMGEVRGDSLVQVASFPRHRREMEASLARHLGVSLPEDGRRTVRSGGLTIWRTGMEQFWLRDRPGRDRSGEFVTLVGPAQGAVTPLSHSRTCLYLEGAPAASVLAKTLTIDLSERAFPVDASAMTGLHHTPVLVHRTSAARYEILVMRTFAVSVWEWLLDLAAEHRPKVEVAADGA